MELAIPNMCGSATNTVKWCLDYLSESSPGMVNWVMIKVEAIVYKNTESMDLLD
jgi:hypothetical protein